MTPRASGKEAAVAEFKEHALRTVSTGTLLNPDQTSMTVGELTRYLLGRFPAQDAEDWDKTGLLVGDPAEELRGVAIALDPTAAAVRAAAGMGANVLLTHHPVFREGPESIVAGGCSYSGSIVFEAIRSGVALMNFHTALDVSHEAQLILPGLLGLECSGVLEPLERDETKGYGQVCELDEAPMTLDELARRCLAVFGRTPRVWGDPATELHTVATWTGSCGNATELCLDQGVDAIVCGEVKYHAALDASQQGLCVVDLGHDVSELPFTRVLADACVEGGVSSDIISIVEQNDNWSHPEARRA